ncbi:hypothetical protein AAG906_021218 [Vitis piasezkii]
MRTSLREMTITILGHRRNRHRPLDFLDEARVTYPSDATLGADAGKPDLEPRRPGPASLERIRPTKKKNGIDNASAATVVGMGDSHEIMRGAVRARHGFDMAMYGWKRLRVGGSSGWLIPMTVSMNVGMEGGEERERWREGGYIAWI